MVTIQWQTCQQPLLKNETLSNHDCSRPQLALSTIMQSMLTLGAEQMSEQTTSGTNIYILRFLKLNANNI